VSESKYSRRALLRGTAVVGALAAVPGLGLLDPGAGQAVKTAQERPPAEGPVFAYVRDAAKGEVVLMVGTKEIVRTDPALVARLIGAVNVS
jgi:hypothetical protein